ncbi:unnamed protein product [Effrenium voratum]|nr:unnamed protein product [Effrenium voratum]
MWKAGAADTKRLLLQQQEAQKLRRPEPNELRELKPKRKRAKPEELPAPSFPRKADRAPSPERLAELRQQVREVQDCQGEDLASASARLLCPRLTFDWGEEEGLMVEPPQGCDLRQLLREEQQRSISVQKAQKLLRS